MAFDDISLDDLAAVGDEEVQQYVAPTMDDVNTWADEASVETNIPRNLIKAIIKRESSFNPTIIPPEGKLPRNHPDYSSAYGYGQLTDGAAADAGVDKYDPRQNVLGTARYYKQQLDTFGDPETALIAYFKGPKVAREHKKAATVAGTRGGTTALKYYSDILKYKDELDAEDEASYAEISPEELAAVDDAPVVQTTQRTQETKPESDPGFQAFLQKYNVRDHGDPRSNYDYYAAYKAGVTPQLYGEAPEADRQEDVAQGRFKEGGDLAGRDLSQTYMWPDEFKKEGHPIPPRQESPEGFTKVDTVPNEKKDPGWLETAVSGPLVGLAKFAKGVTSEQRRQDEGITPAPGFPEGARNPLRREGSIGVKVNKWLDEKLTDFVENSGAAQAVAAATKGTLNEKGEFEFNEKTPKAALATITSMLPQILPSLVPVAGQAVSAGVSKSSLNDDFYKAALENGFTEEEASEYAGEASTLAASLDFVGTLGIAGLKRVPGVGKALSGATSEAIKKLPAPVRGAILNGVVKFAGKTGGAAGIEGLTEYEQNNIQNYYLGRIAAAKGMSPEQIKERFAGKPILKSPDFWLGSLAGGGLKASVLSFDAAAGKMKGKETAVDPAVAQADKMAADRDGDVALAEAEQQLRQRQGGIGIDATRVQTPAEAAVAQAPVDEAMAAGEQNEGAAADLEAQQVKRQNAADRQDNAKERASEIIEGAQDATIEQSTDLQKRAAEYASRNVLPKEPPKDQKPALADKLEGKEQEKPVADLATKSEEETAAESARKLLTDMGYEVKAPDVKPALEQQIDKAQEEQKNALPTAAQKAVAGPTALEQKLQGEAKQEPAPAPKAEPTPASAPVDPNAELKAKIKAAYPDKKPSVKTAMKEFGIKSVKQAKVLINEAYSPTNPVVTAGQPNPQAKEGAKANEEKGPQGQTLLSSQQPQTEQNAQTPEVQPASGKKTGKMVKFGPKDVDEGQVDHLSKMPGNSVTKQHIDEVPDDHWTLSIDGDKFKAVNDIFGHDEGDAVITAIGNMVNKHFPEFFRGREGGEEFFVDFGPTMTPEIRKRVVEFHRDVAENVKVGPDKDPFTLSAGLGKGKVVTEKGAKRLASDALAYEAKDGGRNQVAIDNDGKIEYHRGKEVGVKNYVLKFSEKQAKEALDELVKNGKLDAGAVEKLWNEGRRNEDGQKDSGRGVPEAESKPAAEPEAKPAEVKAEPEPAAQKTPESEPAKEPAAKPVAAEKVGEAKPAPAVQQAKVVGPTSPVEKSDRVKVGKLKANLKKKKKPAETKTEPLVAQREDSPATEGKYTAEQVQRWFIPKDTNKKSPVKVIADESEMTDKQKARALRDQAVGKIKAFFDMDTGEVVIIANKVQSRADAEKSAIHELFHKGARSLHDYVNGTPKAAKLDRIYKQIYASLPQAEKDQISRLYGRPDVFTLVDEVLANRATYSPDPTLVQKAIALIRKILRDAGFKMQWSDNDIVNFIAQARSRGLKDASAKPAGEGTTYQISAYHGSPHKFDKFEAGSRIGTGEGAQAFGYGLYFTSEKEIAEYYADVLAGREGGLDNQASRIVRQAGGDKEKAVALVSQRRRRAQIPAEKEDWDKIAKMITEDSLPEKRLYTVTLHKGKSPAQYDYLQWDGKVTQRQVDKLKDALSGRMGNSNEYELLSDDMDAYVGETGDQLYRALSDFFSPETQEYIAENGQLPDAVAQTPRNDKAASMFLLEAGIDGIEYPAGSISGYDSDARNYVVFDPEAVTIEERMSYQLTDLDADDASTLTEIGRELRKDHGDDFEAWRQDMQDEIGNEYDEHLDDVWEMVGGSLPKYAGDVNINLERIDEDYSVKQLLDDTARQYREHIDWVRRSVRPNEETAETARQLGMTEKQLLKRRRGDNWGAERIYAARQLLAASARRYLDVRAKFADKQANGGLTDADLLEFNLETRKHAAIQAEVSGLAAEAGRALQQFNMIVKGMKDAVSAKALLEEAGGREINEEILKKLLAIDPENLPAVNKFVQKSIWAKTADAVFEYWMNAILSAPTTHMVNLTSNTVSGLYRTLLEKPTAGVADAILAKIQNRPRERFVGEAAAEMHGFTHGLADAFNAFKYAWSTGGTAFGEGKAEYTMQDQGAIPGKAGKIIRTPTRFLSAADEFFKTMIYRATIHAQAYRKARIKGYKGVEFDEAVRNWSEYPTETMMESARQEANYRTFTKPLGKYMQKISYLRNNVPGLKFILPFLRTPTNIAKYALERSPGLSQAILAHKAITGKIKGAEIADEFAKGMVGTMLSLIAVGLAKEGVLTGGGPEDKGERDSLYRDGWLPYSVKFGDRYFSYARMEPLGSILGMASDFGEMDLEDRDDKDIDAMIGKMAMSFGKNITSKTFMAGLSDMINSIDDPERYLGKQVNRMVGSFVPNIIAAGARATDDELKDIQSLGEALRTRVPVLTNTVAGRRDIWGKTIEKSATGLEAFLSPIQVSAESDDPIDKEMRRIKLNVTAPKPEITVKIRGKSEKIELDDREYAQYQKIIGSAAYKAVGQAIRSGEYRQMPDEDKAGFIEGVVNKARREAKEPFVERLMRGRTNTAGNK